MSLESKEIIKCPECGKDNEFIVWQSLNGDLDSDAKQKLLDGTLFHFQCEYCGCESNIVYPILYNDMSNEVMIYFAKEDEIEEIKGTFAFESKFGQAMADYRIRIVTDQNSLREKAIIFENKLDDRVVEILKLIYFSNLKQTRPDAKVEVAYFMVENGEYYIHFLGETPLTANVSPSLYQQIADDLVGKLEKVENEYIIDMQWAIKALSKK